MSLPTPYYEQDGITIYHGDCREILPYLPKVDLVLTDPPYNVGLNYSNGDNRKDYKEWCNDWFLKLPSDNKAISCGIANINVWPKPTWVLCWHKPASMGRCIVGFNNWEPILFYGKVPSQIVDVFKASIIPSKELVNHPCPKPIQWGLWLISHLSKDKHTILDPFMGSGTTLVAAKQLGRKAIGIEIEQRYCDIAIKRLSQGVLNLSTESNSRVALNHGKPFPSLDDKNHTEPQGLFDGEHRRDIENI